MEITQAITITLPGLADDVVRDGGWRQENPGYFAQYEVGESIRAGRGWRYRVTVTADAARSLRAYLADVAGALASMTSDERGSSGQSELRAIRSCLSRWPVATRYHVGTRTSAIMEPRNPYIVIDTNSNSLVGEYAYKVDAQAHAERLNGA